MIASVRACTKNVVLLFLALQAQSGVFGRTEVRLRVRQVIIRLLQQTLRLLLLFAELVQRGGGLLLLGLQTLDLVGARQDARTAGDGAARHGAACIQDLPVQRNDAKAVAEFVGNGNGRVKVLRHDRAAEQIQDDLAIARLTRDKVGGYAAETGTALDAVLVQRPAVDDRQRPGMWRGRCPSVSDIGWQPWRSPRPPRRYSGMALPSATSMATV